VTPGQRWSCSARRRGTSATGRPTEWPRERRSRDPGRSTVTAWHSAAIGSDRRPSIHAADRPRRAVRRRGQPALPDRGARPAQHSRRLARARGDVRGAAEAQVRKLVRLGATQYGGPADPTSSSYGSIGGIQGYLPAHPDTFAELSVLDHNPANAGAFTFADANALDNLPYLTGLVVSNGGAKRILYKRDVGYGQGPGQFISNGQPYRLDVWWQSAGPLGVSKNAVRIALAPPVGAGQLLGQSATGASSNATGANPPCYQLASAATLQLTPGQRARILPDGTAAAPQSAPAQVKLAIAAANEIHTKPYPSPDVHFGSLTQIWPAYDCSGATSYVLYRAGLHSSWPDVSGDLESWGRTGPGKWITVYANSGHTWVVVAGLAFDTADYGGPDIPPGSGPRWRQDPTGNLADGLSYVVRHPPGL
jgi:hypothetical protein